MSGKGSKRRPYKRSLYESNYVRIFNHRKGPKPCTPNSKTISLTSPIWLPND